MPEDNKGFTIKNQRAFSEKGESPVKEKEDNRKEPSMDEDTRQKSKDEDLSKKSTEPAAHIALPEINFSTFIFSLNASAFVHLGVIDDPVEKKKVKNLSLGKQTIDILCMLEEKTRGNLTNEEENILKNILYDLRITYIKQAK